MRNYRKFPVAILAALFFCAPAHLSETDTKDQEETFVTSPYDVPFKKPIGFTYNVAAITSLTFEARFLWGFSKHFSLVVSPMYQNTIELPIYRAQEKKMSFYDIRRFNIGAGVRANFYDYDSWDGWYIEPLGRVGMTWIGPDSFVWSMIPSLMFGYAAVYEIGYTVSFGLGFEWEFLLGKKENMGLATNQLLKAFYGISKFPIMGELSLGWMW